MSTRVDLNADVGEGTGRDVALMPCISSASIACGAHAGDSRTMRDALELAARHGVAAGAHPGYPDPEHFGRRQLDLTPGEIHQSVTEQIRTLLAAAQAAGVPLVHVKPHGALYNAAAADPHIARAVVRAVLDAGADLLLYGLAGSTLLAEAGRAGLRTAAEGFADRGYAADGTLLPRGSAGALIDDPDSAAAQALGMVADRLVQSVGGVAVPVRIDTICIHGDGAHAVAIARRVRERLENAGVRVVAPGAP